MSFIGRLVLTSALVWARPAEPDDAWPPKENLLAMASTLIAMASNLIAMASTLIAMASNLIAMASNLIAMPSNLPQGEPEEDRPVRRLGESLIPYRSFTTGAAVTW